MTVYINLKADEFIRKYENDEKGVILDVRSRYEFEEGHLTNAINIEYDNVSQLLKLERNKNYYIHCKVGGRSAMAAFTLAKAGFENVFNLSEDFEILQKKLVLI